MHARAQPLNEGATRHLSGIPRGYGRLSSHCSRLSGSSAAWPAFLTRFLLRNRNPCCGRCGRCGLLMLCVAHLERILNVSLNTGNPPCGSGLFEARSLPQHSLRPLATKSGEKCGLIWVHTFCRVAHSPTALRCATSEKKNKRSLASWPRSRVHRNERPGMRIRRASRYAFPL